MLLLATSTHKCGLRPKEQGIDLRKLWETFNLVNF